MLADTNLLVTASAGTTVGLLAAHELGRLEDGSLRVATLSGRQAVGNFDPSHPHSLEQRAHMLNPDDPRRAEAFYDGVHRWDEIAPTLSPEAKRNLINIGPAGGDSVVPESTMFMPGATHIKVGTLPITLGGLDHGLGILAGGLKLPAVLNHPTLH